MPNIERPSLKVMKRYIWVQAVAATALYHIIDQVSILGYANYQPSKWHIYQHTAHAITCMNKASV